MRWMEMEMEMGSDHVRPDLPMLTTADALNEKTCDNDMPYARCITLYAQYERMFI
jgi:hypothetical protein